MFKTFFEKWGCFVQVELLSGGVPGEQALTDRSAVLVPACRRDKNNFPFGLAERLATQSSMRGNSAESAPLALSYRRDH
jgi:hypothetical protein